MLQEKTSFTIRNKPLNIEVLCILYFSGIRQFSFYGNKIKIP